MKKVDIVLAVFVYVIPAILLAVVLIVNKPIVNICGIVGIGICHIAIALPIAFIWKAREMTPESVELLKAVRY